MSDNPIHFSKRTLTHIVKEDKKGQNMFRPCEEIYREACEYAECEGYENELAEVYIRGYTRGYTGGAADQFRKYLKARKSQQSSKE